MSKKIISMIIVFTMIVSMIPSAAFAAEADSLSDYRTAEDGSVNGATERSAAVASVCDCGTDDPSIHATTCAMYVAPDDPVCYCVEKCAAVNEWCDVCGFDVTACEGTEAAADVLAWNTSVWVADVIAVSGGELKNSNPITGTSVSYDSAANTATITLNGVNTDQHSAFSGVGYAIEADNLSHLYIVLADGSTNYFELFWHGATKISFISASCPVTISGNGTLTANINNISGKYYGYDLDYTYGIYCYGKTLTVCDGADVHISTDVSSRNVCYGIQASNVIVRDASLSLDMKNNSSSAATACLNQTVSLISGSLSLKSSNGNIGGTINAQGSTSSTAADGTVTYTMTDHTWTYSASGNTIRAWCNKSDHNCAYSNEADAFTLTITAANTTYQKKDITTTFSVGVIEYDLTYSSSVQHPGAVLNDRISAVTGDAVTVIYSGTGDTTYNSATPPSEVGTYRASITLGGATATADFAIGKAALGYTAPTAKASVTKLDEPLANAGSVTTEWYNGYESSACGRMEYRLGASGEWSAEVPTAQGNGTFEVFWRVVPEDAYADRYVSYEYSEPLTVSITGELTLSYYPIYTAEDLLDFAERVNGGERALDAGLMADIDMNGIAWTPIASTGLYYNTTTYADKGYEGTFDGNGHVIKNLTVTGSSTAIASFGFIGTLSGTVKTLGFENFTYTGAGMDSRVGTIVGQLIGGTVENCYAVGININTQVGTQNGVAGGLVGANYAGKVYHCYTSDVTIAAGRFGGVVGDCRGDIGTDDRPGSVLNCRTDAAQVTSTQTGDALSILACYANASAALASGEAVWNLNLSSSDGVWKQTLGTDATPNFNGAQVYKVTNCKNETAYSNINVAGVHSWANRVCTACGALLGDVTGEGKLTALDLALINAYANGKIVFEDEQISVSDFNGDGNVTVEDVTAMKNYILGK